MIFSLNESSCSSMNFTLIGKAYMLCLTSSLSPSCPKMRVESFSVVIIIFGDGISANVLFICSMSFALKS